MEIKKNELDELLEAHLQKPEKVLVYKNGVKANIKDGVPTFRITWSWWAFFGTWMFFLYRKMYVEAAVFFGISLLSYFIPFLSLIVAIASGISAFFFYTKKFTKDLQTAGYEKKSLSEVEYSLQTLGGYNTWVFILYAVLILLNISIQIEILNN